MKLKLWLTAAFLMYRIGVFQAAAQCQTKERSIGGMFLRGHIFKTCTVELPECFIRCDEEVTCQSFNLITSLKVCKMNNRTKEARPEDFMPEPTRLYMIRANNRGTLSPLVWSLLQLSHFTYYCLACVAAGISR